MKKSTIIIILCGFLVSALGFGFMQIFASGRSSEKEFSVERDNAKQLDVKLKFGAGDLTLSGGSEEWLTGSADYNHRRLSPQLDYTKKNDRGILTVDQKKGASFGFNLWNSHNSWDFQLTDDIPINLTVDVGAADATLDLRGVQLKSLKIDGGVSDSTIDLSGDVKNSYKAKIDFGVGDATIYIPEKMGVKLSVDKGIGTINVNGLISQGNGVYVNEAYDGKDYIDLNIDIGVGDVDVITK